MVTAKACDVVGITTLKEKQREVIVSFVRENKVFVSLLTGFRKSMCFVLLQLIYYVLRHRSDTSIAICVSPITSQMMEQSAKYSVQMSIIQLSSYPGPSSYPDPSSYPGLSSYPGASTYPAYSFSCAWPAALSSQCYQSNQVPPITERTLPVIFALFLGTLQSVLVVVINT